MIPTLFLTTLIGCGALDLDPPTPRPLEVHHRDGLSLMVPVGAKVVEQDGELKVDGPLGIRWFDIRYVTSPDPNIAAHTWGNQACDPMLWDEPVELDDTLWIGGGLCTLQHKRFWALAVLQKVEDRYLRITYVADYQRIAFEDAYVDFAHTALTVSGDPTPAQMPEVSELRERVRKNAVRRVGIKPVPGGGLLTTNVHPMVSELWEVRRSTTPPQLGADGSPASDKPNEEPPAPSGPEPTATP